MPTVVEKTVKPDGTGDYLTLQAWLAAQGADLPTLDQIRRAVCYSGGNLSNGTELLFYPAYGIKSDATRYYEIVAAPGHEHPGYWDTDAAYYFNDSATYAIRNFDNVVQLTGMQFKSTGQICFLAPAGTGSYIVDRTLAFGIYGFRTDTGAQTHLLAHSQFVGHAATGSIGIYCRGNGVSITAYNCDLIAQNNGLAFSAYLASTFTSDNCYLCGNKCYNNDGGGATINKGANDATSTAEAVTPALRNIPFSTDTFESVTGDLDLRIVPGSALRGAGADLSATVVAHDFVNTARPQGTNWDIGAHEMTVTVTSVDPGTDTDLGGAAATVYGAGFSEDATVTFGGEAATDVVVVSANEITCTIPAHAVGTVDVVVEDSDGETGTLAGGFVYTASAVPWVPPVEFSPVRFRFPLLRPQRRL